MSLCKEYAFSINVLLTLSFQVVFNKIKTNTFISSKYVCCNYNISFVLIATLKICMNLDYKIMYTFFCKSDKYLLEKTMYCSKKREMYKIYQERI